jgi:hypothetical protein
MSSTDNWLILQARKKKIAMAATSANALVSASHMPPIDDLWTQLQEETRRMVKVYTDELGDPLAIVVDTPPDTIEVRAANGKAVILRVDRDGRMLHQEMRTPDGGVRPRRTPITFTTNASGEAVFSWGGVSGAAGSILRRLV